VPAGGNSTFWGIPNGTLVTLTAQVDGDTCYIYYWMIDGVRWPANPTVPADQTIYLTINRTRTVTAVCGAPPPSTPTPTPTPTPFVQVVITSPQDGSTFTTRLISVVGTVVGDSEITGANITHNGESRSLPLTHQGTEGFNYTFSTTLELVQGSNSITVTATDSQDNSGGDTVTVNADIPIVPISIELTWNTSNTDVDSHLIAPCYAMWDSFGDCYYGHKNPDWDNSGGSSAGDPSLDVDDTWGYGPENIVLVAPPFDGVYQYKVHYYSDHGYGPSTVTVKIWINGVKVFEGNRTMSSGQVWDCACISWPSGTVTAGPCNLRTLTVSSEGCCPVLVEGLPCGNRTVPAGETRVFYGIAQDGNVTLTAQSGDFCRFDQWTVDSAIYEGRTIHVTMDTDHAAVAACTPLYTLTVTNDGCWAVYVTGLPGQGQQEEWVEGNATFVLPEGTEVTLTSSDGDGILFIGWYVDAEGSPRLDNPLIVTMDTDHQVTAVCVPEYNLAVTSAGCCPILVSGLPGGNQTVEPGNTTAFYHIPENTEVTLTAQTGDSCQFDYWVIDDMPQQGNQTMVVHMDDDYYVMAVCTALYTLTVNSECYCSILVEGLPGGNQTVYGNQTEVFQGIPENTYVFLSPEIGCCSYQWFIDDVELQGFEGVLMDQDHSVRCVCSNEC